MASAYDRRGNGTVISRPITAKIFWMSGSMTAKTISRVANDISTSICVNSGCRSARRSSSRKHFTIWK